MKSRHTYQKFLRIEPWMHIFLWVIVLFYPYLKYSEREGGYMMSFAHELNSLVFKMAISYFLFFWFFPKSNKRKLFPVAVLALVVNAMLYELTDRYFHTSDPHYWMHFFTNALTYTSFGIVFFALYSIKNIYYQQMQVEALSQDKVQAEINALKAQINPYFLFNTLNTIYAHSLKKDDKTPELILKLSNGFRYLFHEGQQEFVSLEQEIQHMTEYIDLQQERLVDKVTVKFSTSVTDSKLRIAPLLLIPFVENAFKYTSVLKGEKHPITINVTNEGNDFFFSCTNPFSTKAKTAIDTGWSESGIGISNVKKRLQLLYPEKHDLRITEQDHIFSVNLSISL